MTHNLVINYGLYKKMEIVRPTPATVKEMTKFHSDEYIDFLYRVTPENLDQFNKYQQKCIDFIAKCSQHRRRLSSI